MSQHPFALWTSSRVKDLLLQVRSANYKKTNIDYTVWVRFIEKIRNQRGTENIEYLRKECENIFNKIKLDIKYTSSEANELDIFDLSSIKSFLDIGANKLSTINYYSQKYDHIQEFIGIDVISQSKQFVDPQKSKYYEISPQQRDIPVDPHSIDCVNAQFLFHHMETGESIEKMIQTIYTVLKPGGSFLLWEESFTEISPDIPLLVAQAHRLGMHTDHEYTQAFYDLSIEERRQYIAVNDRIINAENAHMQWTGQYRSWEQRKNLLGKYGFQIQKEWNLGVRINGNIKGGVHCLGEFRAS